MSAGGENLQFKDHVDIVGVFQRVEQGDNVLVVSLLQSLDLGLNRELVSLHQLLVHHLDGHVFGRLNVLREVHYGEGAFAHLLAESVAIVQSLVEPGTGVLAFALQSSKLSTHGDESASIQDQ